MERTRDEAAQLADQLVKRFHTIAVGMQSSLADNQITLGNGKVVDMQQAQQILTPQS